MSDSDFEFDFFEDEPPEETQAERPRVRRSGGGPPPPRRGRGGPTNTAPLLRLGGLIAGAILVIVLFAVWIKSCTGPSKADQYNGYMKKVAVYAKDSQGYASQLLKVLTTPGAKVSDLSTKIQQIASNQQTEVTAVAKLKPPPALQDEQLSLVEALEFRVSGLSGLAAAFDRSAATKNADTASADLARQAERLTASDVVYGDLFRDRSVATMQKEGVAGVAVPASPFTSGPDFASSSYWLPIVQRLTGASGGGPSSTGLHGTGLVSVVAQPSGAKLDANASVNTITANDKLAFDVTVKDTGDSQEVKVQVSLTIVQQPQSIVRTKTINVINPGEDQTVTFANLGQVTFATKTTLKVDVAPVPHESNTTNNSAVYPVIFSLG